MGRCKIVNCSTEKGEKTFFNVPHEPVLRSKWVKQISRHQIFDHIPCSYPVCELHFDPTRVLRMGKRSILQRGTLPTMFPTENGTNVEYVPIVEVSIEPPEIDENEPNAELQPIAEVKIEPEFFDLGHNLYGMDVEYAQPVAVKTEQIDRIDSNQPAAISSTTESKDQQQTGSDAPNCTSPSDEPSERPPLMVSIPPEEYRRLLYQEIQLIRYKEISARKSAEIKRLRDLVAYYRRRTPKNNDTRKSRK